MKNVFSALPVKNRARTVLLLSGLLAGAAAHAQTQPGVVYALGTVTNGFTFGGITYATGSQTLTAIDPTTGTYAAGTLATPSIGQPLTFPSGTTGQTVVGLDFRPSTGDLYALGFNAQLAAPANNAQLYTVSISTGALTAVGGPIRLEISDNNRSNTRGVIPNIGFDFNPRVDRIRVVAPNGADYRLNPNTGAIAATDGTLFYNGSTTVPYVGTAAYTNSRLGLTGTTLYDIDVTANAAVLSTQAPPNNGQLNRVNPVTFFLPNATAGNMGPYPLASPTVGLGLDIYGSTTAYLVEARLSNNAQTTVTPATTYTSNFYTFDLVSGRATLVANIIGQVPLFYSDIAAPISTPKTWTGQVSTNWGADGNWFPTGAPTATDDVVIPGNGTFVTAANVTVTRQPIVSDPEQAASVNLTNGALLTTANGGTLNVSGNFVNNDGAVAGSGTGTVALVGSATQDIGGNALSAFQNLSLGAANATTSGPASVARALTLAGAGNLAVGSDQVFTLRSTAGGTAFVVNSGSGVVTGAATVQRYIDPSLNPGLGYRHYSAPVTNTTLGDLQTSTFSPVFNAAYNSSTTPGATNPYPTVYGYSQAQYEGSPASADTPDFDKGYFSPTAGTDAWASGTGYTVNLGAGNLVDFVGTLATGNISTAGQGRSAKANAGWQLLGNPYPSALDWTQVATSGLNGIDNAVYVFKSSGQYSGNYASYVNGQGTSGGTNVIPVAQGFFVRTSAGATGNLNFTNAQRITTDATAPFQRTTADTRPQLLLELSNGQTASQTDIYFEAGATAGFDKAYDAAALPFLNGLTLASTAGSETLAINGLPALTNAAVTVPLQVAVATDGTYVLRAATLANLPAGYHAYLRDAVLNTYTDLATTPSLSLSLTATPAPGRYAVMFTAASPLATAPAALAALANVYPSPAHGTATLVLPQALRGTSGSTVQLLNSLGQVVLTRTLAANGPDSLELPLTGLAAGIYVVRATTAAGMVAKRLVIQ